MSEERVERLDWIVSRLWRCEGCSDWRTLLAIEPTFYCIRCLILSQWRDLRTGVIWANLGVIETARAAGFRTSWETTELRLRKVKKEGVAVIKFGVNGRGCDGARSGKVQCLIREHFQRGRRDCKRLICVTNVICQNIGLPIDQPRKLKSFCWTVN